MHNMQKCAKIVQKTKTLYAKYAKYAKKIAKNSQKIFSLCREYILHMYAKYPPGTLLMTETVTEYLTQVY